MRKETTDNILTFINPKFFFSVQEKPQLNIILIYQCYHLFKNTVKLTVQHINILKAIETNRLKKNDHIECEYSIIPKGTSQYL